MIRGFIYRIEATAATNEEGQAIRPSDVLPDKGRYKNQIKPLYAAWLICYMDEIREHGWPDLLPDDNHTNKGEPSYDPTAVVLGFIAEMDIRLKACGRDGKICRAYYGDARMPDAIRANWYEFGNDRNDRAASMKSIHYMIKNSLLYCSGRRKRITYAVWLAKRQGRDRATRVEVA